MAMLPRSSSPWTMLTMDEAMRADRATFHAPLALLFCGAVLLLGRIWTFTTLPFLYPKEPKEVPYWIPSHAIAFFKDAHGTITAGREYLGNTREPFALTLAGERIYFITSPQDVSTTYKNIVSLTFDDYVRDMMYQFGGSEDGVSKMWQDPSKDGKGTTLLSPNPLHKCLARLGEDFYRQQLHPGKNLDELQSQFLPNIHWSVDYDKISDKIIVASNTGEKTVSLLGWIREVLLHSATKSFFGDKLLEIELNMF
ncbi:MAG: hypothetical protein Q9167_006222 [Letrouitia subvulpina]